MYDKHDVDRYEVEDSLMESISDLENEIGDYVKEIAELKEKLKTVSIVRDQMLETIESIRGWTDDYCESEEL